MSPDAGIRVRLLPSARGGTSHLQFANTFVLNDRVAVDAGSLGFQEAWPDGCPVRHVLLTHSHADHVASLPILLINDFDPARESITVWGTDETLEALQEHVFNDRIWPDLDRIGSDESPFAHFRRLEPRQEVSVDGLRITPVPVDHTVPTVAFLVQGPEGSVVIGADSGPTEELWERARALPNLRGVFLEASFPNQERELARVSKHLTPELFAAEAAKLPPGTPLFAVHFKPSHDGVIRSELEELGLEHLTVVEPGREYRL